MEQIYENLATIRQKFHKYPERGWREFWTTSEVCGLLENMGYKIEYGKKLFNPKYRINVPEQEELDIWYQKALDRGANPKYLEEMKGGFCGIVAIFDTGKEGPVFAYESELDALPGVTEYEIGTKMIEESLRPTKEGWASENEGIMHACGHDAHITIALGIADYIKKNQDKFTGKFVFFFTPAEEGGQGAKSFADLPIINEIDYYFAYHNAVKPVGNLMLAAQIYLRSFEIFKVTYSLKPQGNPDLAIFQKLGLEYQQGKIKSNSEFVTRYLKDLQAIPNQYSSPIKAAANIVQTVDQIPSRTDGHHQISIMKMTQRSSNVSFKINIRADSNNMAQYYSNEVRKLIKSQADVFNLEMTIEEIEAWKYPAWEQNDQDLVALAMVTWKEMGLGDTAINYPFGEMGTDDDVFLMNKIKDNGGKCFYGILVSDSKQGQIGELHTNKMDIDDNLLTVGVDLTVKMIEKLCKKYGEPK